MKNLIPTLTLLVCVATFTQCGKDTPAPDITVTTSDLTATIAEKPTVGDVIGAIAGSTNSGNVTFTLKTESVAGAFSINSTNGQLTVADATAFDFDTNPSITGTVEVANGSVTKTSNITVTVTEVTTIWTGATMTFSKAANADPALEANQDRLTDKVWLTRGNTSGDLYNVVSESSSASTSPAGTEWAEGTTADITSLTFTTLRGVDKPKDLVNRNLVLKLVEENILIDIKITSWATGGGGGNGGSTGAFTYERSTPN